MALNLVSASSQRLVNSTPAIVNYPFTLGVWWRPASIAVVNCGFYLGATASSQGFSVFNESGNLRFYASDGGGASHANIGGQLAASQWLFFVARAISATNRRLSCIAHTGAISHAQNTTSRTPTDAVVMAVGAREDASPDSFFDGQIGEFWYTDTDIQPDGAQLDNRLLCQLAYRGPFSIPSIRKNIVEYRSFRSRVHTDKWDEVYYGKYGKQTWTNVNDVTIGPHVRLPGSYENHIPSTSGIITITSTFPVDEGDGTVTISGTEVENSTLSANFANDDPDGSATNITYQWERSGTPIGGATSSTYQLQSADVGETITVVVDYTDGEGFSESIESAATGTIAAAPAASTGVDVKGVSVGRGLAPFSGLSKGKGLSWRSGL